MALKDLFNAQSLNQAFPSRLPGTAYGWDTSSTNKEVMLDPETSSAVELLPSMAVKLSGRAGQVKYVSPVSSASDKPYGYIIYKAKALGATVEHNRMFTVARFGQEMAFAFKSDITPGAAVYYDPVDGFATKSSSDTILLGLAVEKVASASSGAPAIAVVEIQCPLVAAAAAGSSVAWSDITGKPEFATVATSGSYADLSNTPTIGNATLTIVSGDTTKGTFTANATEDVSIDIA